MATNDSLRSDSLIIGAGVIGLSLAWELSQRGHQVLIIEAARAGRASSWAGAGILPPAAQQNAMDPYDKLKSLSHRLHPQWHERLRQTTGIDTGFERCGGIYLATTPGELATLVANQSWWDEHGIAYRRLDTTRLGDVEPGLARLRNTHLLGAWQLPDECQLRNPWHLQALRAACIARGVKIIEGCAVSRIVIDEQQRAHAILADQRQLSGDRLCICSGAWARQLLDQLKLPNGLMPVRGQIVLYRCDTPPFHHVVSEGNRYLVPRRDGRLIAGSVEEEVGYRCETTDVSLQEIRRWAEQVLPALASTTIEKTWAGLRPGSFDGLPYLGGVPGTSNLYLAAGHFRSGLHLSCGTAVCMADLMTDQQPAVNLAPFRVGRG